jgi:hypothetical protein
MLRAAPRARAGFLLAILGTVVSSVSLEAQEHLTLRVDAMLYGDNTEFRNPFREGETIFGAALRPAVAIDVNDRVSVTFGVQTNQRFGSDDAFELVRPVAAVVFRGGQSTFLIGTLPGPRAGLPEGPDRSGPHGLLPPLQRETLTFERPYEAGLQWMVAAPRFRQEAWINWQRLNTAEHRERFDAGISVEIRPRPVVAFPLQFHAVHEGGQLFAAGPVADSLGAAVGIRVTPPVGELDFMSIEAYGLLSRYVPDREIPGRTRNGAGFFGRVAAMKRGWRAHLLFWRGDDFIKDEGDANYLSIRRDGSRYRGVRDYAEAGLTRSFNPAPGIALEASGRAHRVERHYEYSYRVLCITRLGWRIR